MENVTVTEDMSDKFTDFFARASKWGGAEVEYDFMEEIETYIGLLEQELESLKQNAQPGYKYGLDGCM